MDFFVFNPFQINISFIPISYVGHSGHKKSFTALFNTKSTVYSANIYVYICAAFMPNIRAKSYLIILLFASQTVLKNSKQFQKYSNFPKIYFSEIIEICLKIVYFEAYLDDFWEIYFWKIAIFLKLLGIFQNGLRSKE